MSDWPQPQAPNDALQQGVVAAGDCALTINSISQVTIAAGTLWAANAAGLLVRSLPASTVLAGIAAAVTNPRLDQVVATSGGTVSLLGGAETAGATLANRSGAAAIPAGTQLLHDILIPAGAGGVTAANVRDRRPWARGYQLSVTFAADIVASVLSAHTLVDATNLQWRVECTGLPLELNWCYTALANTNNVSATYVGYGYDGTLGAQVVQIRDQAITTDIVTVAFRRVLFPTAGSHLIGPTYYNTAGTLTFKGTTGGFSNSFTVRELLAQNANNGTS